MSDRLLLIIEEFIQYCQDQDIHGLNDICVDPDDGYFNVRLEDLVCSRLNTCDEIRCHPLKETSTTEEEND